MKRNLNLFIKRVFDVLVSLIGIVLLTVIPVLIVVPIIIKVTSKGPVIYRQDRIGKGGKTFCMYKFRTMLIPEERVQSDGSKLQPNDSITGVGKFLRKTSIDELPQLFNILCGSMSVVGPRPMIPSMYSKITDEEKRRCIMRPGVTGLAQVNGRNNLTWAEKLRYDVEYIDNFCLWIDITILFKTVLVVIKNEGIDYVHMMKDERSIEKSTPTNASAGRIGNSK